MANVGDDVSQLQVLMIAYACSPYRGSEPGVGWRRAATMARHCKVVVMTEECEFRSDIERFQRENGPIQNMRFRYVPRMFATERVWQLLSEIRPLYYAAYRRWHKHALREAVELSREVRFDLVHQSTMCGYREPGEFWRLGIPFVWGPVGGTQNYPWRFLGQAGPMAAITESARNLINLFQMRYSRRVRAAARHADAMLTAHPEGGSDFERIHGVVTGCMLDVGVDHVTDQPRRYRGRSRRLRLLWSGFFEHRKALQLLIRALAELPDDVGWELHVLGRGPMERRWRRLAQRLNVDDRCTWIGWVPHEEAMKQNEWADVFVFTSLRDTCGTVVIEALGSGLPVICLDHQGAGYVVTDECGLKIPVSSPKQVIEGLANAIELVATDDELLEALSEGAIRRASEFFWRNHGERLAGIYRDVARDRPSRELETSTVDAGGAW